MAQKVKVLILLRSSIDLKRNSPCAVRNEELSNDPEPFMGAGVKLYFSLNSSFYRSGTIAFVKS